jgi:HEAT repeat protein
LGKLGTVDCIEILQKHFNHPAPLFRSYIIKSLGMTDNEQAIPLIIEALKDSNNTVFASASECLSRFGRKAVPYLTNLLKQGNDDARCVAAWNLGEIAESQCVPELVQVLLEEKNEEVAALCIWALGRIGAYSDEVVNTLKQAILQEAPEIRLRAEVALKKITRNLN